MNCSRCCREVGERWKYCAYCGRRLALSKEAREEEFRIAGWTKVVEGGLVIWTRPMKSEDLIIPLEEK